ncbi:MAG TPA: serine hydrolase domain-containing protein [Vicinamibacteria bacterium]
MSTKASRPALLVLVVALAWVARAGSEEARAIADDRFPAAIAKGRAVVQDVVARGAAPGVGVAVAVGGGVVWSEGFGRADLEHDVPATRLTRFALGSVSKTLTMAAALRLVDQGRLDLDAPVRSSLADFPHRDPGVTVRRLAAHQSGLADAFAGRSFLTATFFPTVDAAYQEIKKEALESPPGSRTSYATGLYTIIARVMEVAAGRSYAEVMKQEVFGPLGLESVVENDRRRILARRASLYARSEAGVLENAPYFDPSHKLAGAGYLSSAEDVARLGAALLRPGFLSDAARAEMLRTVPLRDGSPTPFGLGLRKDVIDGRPTWNQPGGGPGMSAWLFLHVEDDLVIALLSNVPTGPMGGRTHREIAVAFREAIREGARGGRASS